MNADPRIDEAAQILHGLTALSGGSSVSITARKFPRFGAAEAGKGLVLEQRSFPLREVPDPLPIAGGMDEIVITVDGALDDCDSTLGLLNQVNSVLGNVQSSTNWDARTFLGNSVEHPRRYQVTVFIDSFGVVPSA